MDGCQLELCIGRIDAIYIPTSQRISCPKVGPVCLVALGLLLTCSTQASSPPSVPAHGVAATSRYTTHISAFLFIPAIALMDLPALPVKAEILALVLPAGTGKF